MPDKANGKIARASLSEPLDVPPRTYHPGQVNQPVHESVPWPKQSDSKQPQISRSDNLLRSSATNRAIRARKSTFLFQQGHTSNAFQRYSLSNRGDNGQRGTPRKGADNAHLHISNRAQKNKSSWNFVAWLKGSPHGQYFLLAVFGITLLFGGSGAWMSSDGSPEFDNSFSQSLWLAWGCFFDPGTQMSIIASDSQKNKMVVVWFSILGFTFNLVMLGLVVDRMRLILQRWHELFSRVVKNNHTVILGFNEKTLFLLKEILMDENPPACIVILDEVDKYHTSTIIKRYVGEAMLKKTKIIVHSGDPLDSIKQERVSCASAKNIFLLGRESKPRKSDQATIQATMALNSITPRPCNGMILAEVRMNSNVRVVETVGKGLPIVGVVTRTVINRVVCVSALSRVLGETYMDVVSFADGDQIYLGAPLPEQVGRSFGEASHVFVDACLLGVHKLGDESCLISPPDELIIEPTDRILYVAKEETLRMDYTHAHSHSDSNALLQAHPLSSVTQSHPEHLPADIQLPVLTQSDLYNADMTKNKPQQERNVVIIGLPVDIAEFIRALDSFLPAGSKVTILSNNNKNRRKRLLDEAGVSLNGDGLRNIQTLEHIIGPTTSKLHLSRLNLKETYSFIVLADDVDDNEAVAAVDAACFSTVIKLCALLDAQGIGDHVTIVAELLEARNASNSKMMADLLPSRVLLFESNKLETGLFHIACNHTRVYNSIVTMLNPQQSPNIGIVAITAYISKEELLKRNGLVSFAELQTRARMRQEVALGFMSSESIFCLNPSSKYDELHFSEHDGLVVVRHVNGVLGHRHVVEAANAKMRATGDVFKVPERQPDKYVFKEATPEDELEMLRDRMGESSGSDDD